MGPKPIVKKSSAEEIRKITKKARNQAYERNIEYAHEEIQSAALRGEWSCWISVADCYERVQDFINYFINLCYSAGFNDEDCSVFINWRESV